jgi:periplasmic protein CpxP/Spy
MKVLITAFLVTALCNLAGAQGPAATPQERAQRTVDLLTERLSLTADQKGQVSTIILSQAKAQDSIRLAAGDGADMQALRPKFVSLYEANDIKIIALLNDEQKKAYATYIEVRRNRMVPRQ